MPYRKLETGAAWACSMEVQPLLTFLKKYEPNLLAHFLLFPPSLTGLANLSSSLSISQWINSDTKEKAVLFLSLMQFLRTKPYTSCLRHSYWNLSSSFYCNISFYRKDMHEMAVQLFVLHMKFNTFCVWEWTLVDNNMWCLFPCGQNNILLTHRWPSTAVTMSFLEEWPTFW